MEFRVGILGATGYIGTPYRKEIREAGDQARIVALCARRMDRLERAAREDGATFVTQDWRRVVEHPDVNLVIVATPDAHHCEAVLACAEQKKHLVCEKPVGANAAEAGRMWSVYCGTALGHFVPFWTRYTNVFVRARQVVASGSLGEIKAVIYRWHNPRPAAMPFTWRDDATVSAGGSIADVGSHAYDTVRWILGQEARRVLAHGDTITPDKPDVGAIDLAEAIAWGKSHRASESKATRRGTAYDYAGIAWEFEGGAVGTLVLSHAPYLRKNLAPELELHGTDASLAVDRARSTLTMVQSGQEAPAVETVADDGWGNRFARFVFPAVRERAVGGGTQHPGLDDGWRVQVFTDAAALSAREGKWMQLAERSPTRGQA